MCSKQFIQFYSISGLFKPKMNALELQMLLVFKYFISVSSWLRVNELCFLFSLQNNYSTLPPRLSHFPYYNINQKNKTWIFSHDKNVGKTTTTLIKILKQILVYNPALYCSSSN